MTSAPRPLRYKQLPFLDDDQLLASIQQLPWPALLSSSLNKLAGGRFSIACAAPLKQLEIHSKADAEQLNCLAQPPQPLNPPPPVELPFVSGWLGYLSYDAGRLFENLPQQAQEDIPLPWIRLGYYAWSLVSDHQTGTTWLSGDFPEALAAEIEARAAEKTPASLADSFKLMAPFTSNMTAAEYRHKFARIQNYLRAGDVYQVNLAQRFSAPFCGHPRNCWPALRQQVEAPFAAYLDYGSEQLLSFSPERFLQVDTRRQVESKPIKGTRPRHPAPFKDQALASELLRHPKDRAENLMIVDLLRNDLGRVCVPGSIQVPDLFTLESNSYVHHLVSRITGQLQPATHPLALLQASFPGGSITGAPKLRAMQIIEELEPCRRSVYCGSIGYLDDRGNLDFNIAIRTFIATENRLHLWGGGGLVADSQAEAEYAETLHKVARLLRVLEPDFAKGL